MTENVVTLPVSADRTEATPETPMAYACGCGCASFILLESGAIQCANCDVDVRTIAPQAGWYVPETKDLRPDDAPNTITTRIVGPGRDTAMRDLAAARMRKALETPQEVLVAAAVSKAGDGIMFPAARDPDTIALQIAALDDMMRRLFELLPAAETDDDDAEDADEDYDEDADDEDESHLDPDIRSENLRVPVTGWNLTPIDDDAPAETKD